MSSLFPEQPILFYPSLACRLGAEPAILLAVYHQYARHHGGLDDEGTAQFVIRRREWLELAPYWDEDKLALLTNTLVEQGLVEAQFLANGSIRLAVMDNVATGPAATSSASPEPQPVSISEPDPVARVGAPETEAVLPSAETFLPSVKSEAAAAASAPLAVDMPPVVIPRQESIYQPPVMAPAQQPAPFQPAPVAASALGYGHVARGPAPSFGGSTGWSKPQDPLEQLFAQQEQHNRQLKSISPDWKPQSTTLQMLSKQGVTQAFALACVDQFVAYYMEQGKRKKSWEQPFMKWAKRDWVDAQNKQNRQQAGNNYPNNTQQGSYGERDQTRTRQDKRERITNAVMDIKNTDW